MRGFNRWVLTSLFAVSAAISLPGCGGSDGDGGDVAGNHAPVANTDSFTVSANDAATRLDVLRNDTSAPDQNETLTITGVSQPSAGVVTLPDAPVSSVNFRPGSSFTGLVTFTYTISDGRGGVASATVSVVVTRDNTPAPPTGPAGGVLPERTTGGGQCAASQTLGLAYDLVDQCITVSNPSNTTLTIPVPAGLVFESESPTVQNAIVMQDHAIILAPGETKTVRVQAFCMNKDRDAAPQTAGSANFLRRGVTTHPGLLSVISAIRGKALDAEHKLNGLQGVIWTVIEKGSMGPTEEAVLQSF